MNSFRCARKVFSTEVSLHTNKRCFGATFQGKPIPISDFLQPLPTKGGRGKSAATALPDGSLIALRRMRTVPLSAVRYPLSAPLSSRARRRRSSEWNFSRVGTPKWNAGPCYNPGIDVGGKREIPHVRIPERARIEFFALLEYLGRGESVFGVSAAVLPSDQPGILGGAFFGICRRAREEARVWETDHGRTEHGRSSDESGKCERRRRTRGGSIVQLLREW